jgi:alpha-tubulin suppressor-like RCC1 family protein
VAVLDSAGNVVSSAQMGISLTLGANKPNGSLSGRVTATPVLGIATFDSVVIAHAGSGYSLAANGGLLKPVLSDSLAIQPAAPAKLVFQAQPATTAAGAALAPVQVAVSDAFDNPTPAATGVVTLAIGRGATLRGTVSVAASAGIATFADLRINRADSGYVITATSGALTAAISALFAVTPLSGTRLVFQSSPTGGAAGYAFDSPVSVAVVDSFNNVSASTAPITVALGANPSGGTLGGTKTVNAQRGVASFTDLAIDRAGTGYTLTAGGNALASGTSPAIAVANPVTVRQGIMAAGLFTTCGVSTGGQTRCWGNGTHGELGNGRLLRSATPVAISGGLSFDSISVGAADGSFVCGIRHGGGVYCWGNDAYGLLADGGSISRATPAPIAGSSNFVAVSAGGDHACALGTDGHMSCWGIMGDTHDAPGPDPSSATPVLVSPSLTFRALSAGDEHTCGIEIDGSVFCFDFHYGDFNTSFSGNYRAISAGLLHTCAIAADSTAWCWGPTAANRNAPAAVPGGYKFTAISAGFDYTCGITTTQDGVCWGTNDYGELGNGSTGASTSPVMVSGGLKFASITAGKSGDCLVSNKYVACNNTCAVTTAGQAWCWGYNGEGEVGDGTSQIRLTPQPVSGGGSYSRIATNGRTSCAISNSGAVSCWGANWNGALGDGAAPSTTVPIAVSGGFAATQVSGLGPVQCALTSGGTTSCWGSGPAGLLGNPSTDTTSSPTQVAGGHSFVTLSVGDYHACGIAADGSAWCWGQNESGELGDGSTTSSATPVAVGGPKFSAIAVSSSGPFRNTCGLAVSGEAYCWGANNWGQLGDGTFTQQSLPVPVRGGLHFASLSAGSSTACALTAQGKAYCWGIGNTTPTLVTGNHTFAAISVSATTCALTPTGAAWCWGLNGHGQIGNGTSDPNATYFDPTAVSGGLKFEAISGSGTQTCAVTTGGSAYCWGLNASGQLGNGTTNDALVPTPVSSGSFGAPARVMRR